MAVQWLLVRVCAVAILMQVAASQVYDTSLNLREYSRHTYASPSNYIHPYFYDSICRCVWIGVDSVQIGNSSGWKWSGMDQIVNVSFCFPTFWF